MNLSFPRAVRAILIPTRDERLELDRSLQDAAPVMALAMVDVPTIVHYMLDQWIVNYLDESLAQAQGVNPESMAYHTALFDFIHHTPEISQSRERTEQMKYVLASVWEFVMNSIVPVLKAQHLTYQELNASHIESWINSDVIVRFGGLR